jgi:hypothetical protein
MPLRCQIDVNIYAHELQFDVQHLYCILFSDIILTSYLFIFAFASQFTCGKMSSLTFHKINHRYRGHVIIDNIYAKARYVQVRMKQF